MTKEKIVAHGSIYNFFWSLFSGLIENVMKNAFSEKKYVLQIWKTSNCNNHQPVEKVPTDCPTYESGSALMKIEMRFTPFFVEICNNLNTQQNFSKIKFFR